MNSQNKSFKNVGWNEFTKRIFWTLVDLRIRIQRIPTDSTSLLYKGLVRICWIHQIFWKLCHETNPWNESFEHPRMKQIHKTNLLNTAGWNESTNRIFWKLTNQIKMNPWIRKTNPHFYKPPLHPLEVTFYNIFDCYLCLFEIKLINLIFKYLQSNIFQWPQNIKKMEDNYYFLV